MVRLPRQSGFKESRYAHLLSGPPEAAPAETPSSEPSGAADGDRVGRLEQEVAGLRRELAELKAQLAEFRRPPG